PTYTLPSASTLTTCGQWNSPACRPTPPKRLISWRFWRLITYTRELVRSATYMQLCFASVEKFTVPEVPYPVCGATKTSPTNPHLPTSPLGLEHTLPAS